MQTVWSSTEQKLFTKALEKHGNNPIEDIWLTISESIGTKSPKETHAFAFSYLLQLQASSRDFLEQTRLHNIEYTQWSEDENRIFEGFLCVFTETEENRWEKISGALCAKKFYRSPEEVERHYLKMVFDINNIVCNEKVFTTFETSTNVLKRKQRESLEKMDLITPLKKAKSVLQPRNVGSTPFLSVS